MRPEMPRANLGRLSKLDAYRLLRACWWGKPGPLQLSERAWRQGRGGWYLFPPETRPPAKKPPLKFAHPHEGGG